MEDVTTLRKETAEILIFAIHNTVQREVRRRLIHYPIGLKVRYMRMPNPIDRIFHISLIKDGKAVALSDPKVNNLMPYDRKVECVKQTDFTVASEDWREGCYLAIGLNGVHGIEGAYAILEIDGEYIGAPDRAASHLANIWEYRVERVDRGYTYYFPLEKRHCGKKITAYVLGLDAKYSDYPVDIYYATQTASSKAKSFICKSLR